MNIPEDIIKNHAHLSKTSIAFLDFIKTQPSALSKSSFKVLFSDPRTISFKMQPWPAFINKKMKFEFKKSTEGIFKLITQIPGRIFDSDTEKIARYYGISRDKAEYFLYGNREEDMAYLLGRGDFIISNTNELKCIEFNVQSSLGGLEADFLEQVYTGLPIISKFLKDYKVKYQPNQISLFNSLLENILNFLVSRFGINQLKCIEINIALTFPDQNYEYRDFVQLLFNQIYKKFLKQRNLNTNGEIVFCTFGAMQVENHSVMVQGKKIMFIFEFSMGNVPQSIMDVVNYGSLLLLNGPISQLLSDKLNFALLSENQDTDIFNMQEREIIKKYIPWTRKVVPDLEEFILTHQDQLVLKPSGECGGKNVTLGSAVSPDIWKQNIKFALSNEKYIVQKIVQSAMYMYQYGEQGVHPHEAIWGIFSMGGSYAGGWVRIMPQTKEKKVINSTQGASETIIIEVEE